jgi:beta-lactamase class A
MNDVSNWAAVTEAVRRVEAAGTVGVAVVGPSGETWQRRGDRKFSAASTVKIPIMVEVYRQVDAGRRALDDRVALTEGDKADGSGVLLHLHSGLELTLGDLIYLMISISDNTATNLLLRLAGMEAVNRTMLELGMANSNLGREMRGRPATAEEVENFATPNDYARAIAAILDGRAASAESCAAMQAMLERQQNGRRIGRHVPTTSSTVRWGSKTGSIVGVTNDVGYVVAPNGRLIIAVYCENFPDQHTGEQVIGEIARAALADTGVAGPLFTS